MDEQLTQTIAAFCAGKEDHSGTALIDLMIARLRNEQRFTEISAALQRFLKSASIGEPRVWSAINLIVEKLDLRDARLAREIELTFDKSFPVRVLDRFQQLRAFQAAGGVITPKLLKVESRLRDELPQFWLDLAIDAYKGDEAGFVDAASALVRSTTLNWKDMRKRITKIASVMGTGSGIKALVSIAKAFSGDEIRQGFLQAIDERLGTRLAESAEASPRKNRNGRSAEGPTTLEIKIKRRVAASLDRGKPWIAKLDNAIAA